MLDQRLEGREWLADTYSIADIATGPWIGGLEFYGATEEVGLPSFSNVRRWYDAFRARPAVQRGLDAVQG